MFLKFWNLKALREHCATKKSGNGSSESGLSIVETLVAMALLGVIVAGAASFSRYSSKNLSALRGGTVGENIEKNIRAAATNAVNISLSSGSSGTLKACLDQIKALQGEVSPSGGGCAPMPAPASFDLRDQIGNKLGGSTFAPQTYDLSGVACGAGTTNCYIRAETAYQLICPANEPACTKASTVRTLYRISAETIAKGGRAGSLSTFQERSGMVDMPLSNIKMTALGNVKCGPGLALTGVTEKGQPVCIKNVSAQSKNVGIPLMKLEANPAKAITLGTLTENVADDEVLVMVATAELPCPCRVENYGGRCDVGGSCGFTNGVPADNLVEIREVYNYFTDRVDCCYPVQTGTDAKGNPIIKSQNFILREPISDVRYEPKGYETACYLAGIFRVYINNVLVQDGQTSTCEGNFRFTYSPPKEQKGNFAIRVEAIYGGQSHPGMDLITSASKIPYIYVKNFNLMTLKFPQQKSAIK